jgi:glucokinase
LPVIAHWQNTKASANSILQKKLVDALDRNNQTMLLAGDIGGTKTVLGIFTAEAGPRCPLVERRYRSDDYASLSSIVAEFVAEQGEIAEAGSFGVAGPVREGRVRVTNLPWEVDGRVLSQTLGGAPVSLLNDLEAVANAVPILQPSDLEIVKPGTRDQRGPIAIIAPGTGLGEAYLFWDGSRYRPVPSEGGHTDFAPSTELELELLDYLQPRLGHVSYERVCSGSGIPNLYAFFRDTGRASEPAWLRKQLAEAEDRTPIIVRAAQEKGVEICQATLELFLSILGSEAGNLVLQVLATGGVFLGGGIPPRILGELKGRTFLESFTRKGRFSNLLEEAPVDVIMNPKAALYGAANYGFLMTRGET